MWVPEWPNCYYNHKEVMRHIAWLGGGAACHQACRLSYFRLGSQPRAARIPQSPQCFFCPGITVLDVGLSTAPAWPYHNLNINLNIVLILSFPMCSSSLLEPLRVGRCWCHQHTRAHRTMIETFIATDPNTMWTPTSCRSVPNRPRNALVSCLGACMLSACCCQWPVTCFGLE